MRKKIKITEIIKNELNIDYILENLKLLAEKKVLSTSLEKDDTNIYLEIVIEEAFYEDVLKMIKECVSDIYCLNYKREFFDKKIFLRDIDEQKSDLLISSIVGADYLDDKLYFEENLKNSDRYDINAQFLFQFDKIKKRWEQIIGHLPQEIVSIVYYDFLSFLIQDPIADNVIYVEDNEKVYNKNYQLRNVSKLISKSEKYSVLKEIIISKPEKVVLINSSAEIICNELDEIIKNSIPFVEK